MLDERRELLAGGTAPNDEKIHNLERSILRARDLLTSNGEHVDAFDPPIAAPPPAPAPAQPSDGGNLVP
jgi:hypothetical protein